jgi:hypothetical protein
VRWADALADAGPVGAAAAERLLRPGVVLLGTVRLDGTARISPCEPFAWEGELWLPMLQGSRKVADLRRDARVLVHSIVTGREGTEGEVKLRGAAHELDDGARRRRLCHAIAAALPFAPEPDRVDAFAVDVASIVHVSWSAEGDQRVAMWPERRRFVRRATSATSLGPPEAEITT